MALLVIYLVTPPLTADRVPNQLTATLHVSLNVTVKVQNYAMLKTSSVFTRDFSIFVFFRMIIMMIQVGLACTELQLGAAMCLFPRINEDLNKKIS